MSAAAQVERLESLLGRIAQNRTDAPVRGASADHAPEASASPAGASPASASPASASPPTASARADALGAPPVRFTPMEQAVNVGLGDAEEPDEPEVVITMDDDDDEPELTLDSGPVDLGDLDEDGELSLDSDLKPTAPLGTRAPARSAAPTPVPSATPAPRTAPSSSPAQPAAARGVGPSDATPIPTAVPIAKEPVAKVVKEARPTTFGELISRALALRPRD